jgi:hypothetical protein
MISQQNSFDPAKGSSALSAPLCALMQQRLRWPILVVVLLATPLCPPSAAQSTTLPDQLTFQTHNAWSPNLNVPADEVMVYGIDNTLADRITSWRKHGYRVSVMTDVAWGQYGTYLDGDFDGKRHWDDAQTEADGKLVFHGGSKNIPYIAPSEAYGRFLVAGVLHGLDAGADAVYLEEPEFWARSGWSPTFKREWQQFYNQP